jgi:hypothetical protein
MEMTIRFTPGNTNMHNFGADELQDYFKRVEPRQSINPAAKGSVNGR